MTGRHHAALALLCILAALCAATVALATEAATGDWKSYTFANGVNDMAASGNSLWWATGGGAVRVDLTTLTPEVLNRARGTLVSDTLSSVSIGSDGIVWFGSVDRGVSGYDPSTSSWRRIQEIDGLPDSKIRTLASSGISLWVGSSRGFAEFRDGLATKNSCTEGIDLGCGLVSFDVRSIFLAGSTQWFGTAAGVSRLNASTWDTLNAGLAARTVTSVVGFGDDVWCVAGPTISGGGPYVLNGSAWVAQWAGLENVLTRRLEVLDGALYAAADAGLFRWNGAEWTPIGSLINATCAALDSQGRLWAGTADSGAFWWDGSAWHQVLAPGPRSNTRIRALALGADGTLWFSHESAVLGSFSAAGWAQYDAFNTSGGLEGQWSAGLGIASNGDLWVGHCCCSDNEFCRVDRRSANGVWTPFPSILDVMTIDQDPSGDLWFGTVSHGTGDVENGIFFLAHNDSVLTQLLVADTGGCLPSNEVRVILAPTDGRVILGSNGDGVAVWDYGASVTDLSDDRCASYRQSRGSLPGDDVTSLLVRGGDLWVGTTAGISVIKLADGTSHFITSRQGLAGDQVTGLASDPLGRVWVSTTSGASVITPASGAPKISNFTYPDLVNSRLSSVLVDDRGGRVWFGSDRGLSSYQAWSPGGETPGGLRASVYPNPFRPGRDGGLRLLASAGGPLHGEIYDLSGRRIASFTGVQAGGALWNGTMASGEPAPSGHYVIVIRSASGAVARAHVAVIR